MPVTIDTNILSLNELLQEKITIFYKEQKSSFKGIKLLILNLMPMKVETESQFLRILASTPFNIKVDFLYVETHNYKNTDKEYVIQNYKTFPQIKNHNYDGMIITGAPVELMEFEEVDYWDELKDILDYAKEKVKSTFFICWAAQAALYHYYGIPKELYKQKLFGVFPHIVKDKNSSLVKGFDDVFMVPHSRHTGISKEHIKEQNRLEILSESEVAGVYLVATSDKKQVFVTGHSEYSRLTLKCEYERDKSKGLNINIPINYFKDDDFKSEPILKWRAHSYLLYTNWLSELSH
jgi:homoserine O-succinyltransferase